jgi:hypothetical protein
MVPFSLKNAGVRAHFTLHCLQPEEQRSRSERAGLPHPEESVLMMKA